MEKSNMVNYKEGRRMADYHAGGGVGIRLATPRIDQKSFVGMDTKMKILFCVLSLLCFFMSASLAASIKTLAESLQ